MDRYARQTVLPELGPVRQAKLRQSTAVVIGCGALGSVSGEILARAGLGNLILIDRDLVELTNLQRQMLYTERDVEQRLPKAEAMRRHLLEINSEIQVTAVTADLNYRNAPELLAGADVLLDGTDNYLARLLINDVALELEIPWVYGGALGTTGMVMPIIPGRTPCFRCMVPELPAAGQLDTCDLVGVLGGVTAAVASFQATQAIHLLVDAATVPLPLVEFNLWTGAWRELALPADPACPACRLGNRDFLQGRHGREAIALCGRDMVQVWPSDGSAPDFAALSRRLAGLGDVEQTRFTLRFSPAHSEQSITLFGDGRALIKGTNDPNLALSIYTRYLG